MEMKLDNIISCDYTCFTISNFELRNVVWNGRFRNVQHDDGYVRVMPSHLRKSLTCSSLSARRNVSMLLPNIHTAQKLGFRNYSNVKGGIVFVARARARHKNNSILHASPPSPLTHLSTPATITTTITTTPNIRPQGFWTNV